MRTLVLRGRAWWRAVQEECADVLEAIPLWWTPAAIVAASAVALYVEMVMVRWHATCFHAFAIFKNVSLLSCFLGLGIGYGLSGRRRSTLPTFLPLLALQALLFGLLSCTNLGGRRINPVAEQLVMGTRGGHWGWLDAVEGDGFLALVFVLNALMFVPLGQLAGRLMSRLPRVRSYALNLLGSLAGIGLFFLLSLLWTPPAVWLGVAALGVAPFLLGRPYSPRLAGGLRKAPPASRGLYGGTLQVASVAVILIVLGVVPQRYEQTFYSPYQLITLCAPAPTATSPAPTIKVNHTFFQDLVDCSGRAKTEDEVARYYNLPYRLRPQPGDVLVVGAGAGNDVAAALRHKAQTVTAVEIDPAILALGARLHPERPYQDPRTRPVLNDARSFLRQTEQHFDLVVYGLLDSHTNLGAMTNVRLDSFVYTVEGFRDAVAHLNEDGLLVVSYLVLDPRQGDKLFAMLRAAYPATPRVFEAGRGLTFVTGPGLARLPAQLEGVQEETAHFAQSAAGAEVATDDWPFFYMQQRTYPVTYAVMILLLLGLSAWLVLRYLRPRRAERPPGRVSPSGLRALCSAPAAGLFFLGAGFMLIETKGITELGLVFGNTWAVSALVVGGILVMVFLANVWVLYRGPVGRGWAFALLAATLFLGWGVTRLQMAGVVVPALRLVLPVVLTAPLFFAGLIFSGELARGGDIGAIFSANLFGAMLGGFLEYNSMYWGLSSLYPLGIALYALACLCLACFARKAEGGGRMQPVQVIGYRVRQRERPAQSPAPADRSPVAYKAREERA